MKEFKVYHRSEHPISRKNISPYALKVLYRLRSQGFWSFLVGGALRDLLRGIEPRDFDVATNADIPEIKNIFRNARVIGKRFPIVHVYFGSDLIEISSLKAEGDYTKYELLRADALQRDFTVNSIFYDINDFRILDPLGAVAHIKENRIVPIGNAVEKFQEDPVRMLRALKLEIKHGFSLDSETEAAIRRCAPCLVDVGPGRRYEEMTRILFSDFREAMLVRCQELNLLAPIWENGSRLMKEQGPELFTRAATTTPIHMSRGSYAKHSHTHFWFRLYLLTGLYKDTLSLSEAREQLDLFLEPLGMPFRHPLVEGLVGLSLMGAGQGEELRKLSRESRQLIGGYLEHYKPEWMASFAELAGEKRDERKPVKGKRRRRRWRGRGPKHAR